MQNIKRILFIAISVFIAISCNKSKSGSEVALMNRLDTASYAFGLSFANSLKHSNYITELNVDATAAAIRDVYSASEDTVFTQNEISLILNSFIKEAREERIQANLDASNKFLNSNKKSKDIQVTESGLQYRIIKEGTGKTPSVNDRVKCNYIGTLIDGREFDSSFKRGKPTEFRVSGVIKGWQEALKMMKEGGKWELFVPPELGYGLRVRPGGMIEPNMALIFELELIEVIAPEEKKQ
jgi:FKBP-type peptidyl-prolyl cis-trans isomerase